MEKNNVNDLIVYVSSPPSHFKRKSGKRDRKKGKAKAKQKRAERTRRGAGGGGRKEGRKMEKPWDCFIRLEEDC